MLTPEEKITLDNWPKNNHGARICTKQAPMPLEFNKTGRWEHDDVHETDYDGDYYIEYKCHSCGHVFRQEIPD